MLVCSRCGTKIIVAGHACAACGHRGSVEARFFHGTILDPPASTGDDLATHHASSSGTLPEELRAWSPWFTLTQGVVFGPAAGALFGARNRQRLVPDSPDAWTVTALVLAGQLLINAGAGYLARSNLALGATLIALYNLVVAALLVRWQWEPVRQRRLEVPGHHAPGADAVVPVLVGLVLALSGGYLSYRLADRLSHQAFSQFITEKLPTPASPAMRTMEFPGMPKG